jgi:hypothetical protein
MNKPLRESPRPEREEPIHPLANALGYVVAWLLGCCALSVICFPAFFVLILLQGSMLACLIGIAYFVVVIPLLPRRASDDLETGVRKALEKLGIPVAASNTGPSRS